MSSIQTKVARGMAYLTVETDAEGAFIRLDGTIYRPDGLLLKDTENNSRLRKSTVRMRASGKAHPPEEVAFADPVPGSRMLCLVTPGYVQGGGIRVLSKLDPSCAAPLAESALHGDHQAWMTWSDERAPAGSRSASSASNAVRNA